jgi:hypothetical protein
MQSILRPEFTTPGDHINRKCRVIEGQQQQNKKLKMQDLKSPEIFHGKPHIRLELGVRLHSITIRRNKLTLAIHGVEDRGL